MENEIEDLLIARLSTARLSNFLFTTKGDVSLALRLYEWNARISAATFETLGHVEVIVRNAMHRELTNWSLDRFNNPSWFENHHGLFQVNALKDIEIASARVLRRQPTVSGDRLVSELNFGFWRFLLAKQYRTTLWPSALQRAFPGVDRSEVKELARRFSQLHVLRNRVAHHEPIFMRSLDNDLLDCQFVLNAVCQVAGNWVMGISKAYELLDQRPL